MPPCQAAGSRLSNFQYEVILLMLMQTVKILSILHFIFHIRTVNKMEHITLKILLQNTDVINLPISKHIQITLY